MRFSQHFWRVVRLRSFRFRFFGRSIVFNIVIVRSISHKHQIRQKEKKKNIDHRARTAHQRVTLPAETRESDLLFFYFLS